MISLQPNDSYSDTLDDLAPDLTPMLDILFILLVFFMLTAGTVLQSLKLTLPSSVAEELSNITEPKHIMLEIRRSGYAINGKEINDLNLLKQQVVEIIQSQPENKLIIAGDKNTPMEQLLKVLTYLQSQGIEAANILMQSENNP